MKRFNRMLVCALIAALFMLVAPGFALAAGDWYASHLDALKREAGVKRVVALCDLTGDGDPELVSLAFSDGGLGGVQLLGSGPAFDLGPFSLKGVKSVGVQLRRDSSKVRCLRIGITDKQGSRTTSLVLGLTEGSGGALTPVYTAKQVKSGGKTRYYVDDVEVSRSRYAKEKKAFESAYKKVGNLPKVTIAKSDKDKAIGSKLSLLKKRYAAFSTAKKVVLSKTSANTTAGKALKLKATITPASAAALDAVQWTSSDEKIATVDQNGNVKAIAVGSAKITAKTQSGKSKSCKLTVKGPKPTKVALSKSALTLVRGDSGALTGTVSPAGASQALTWKSSNTKVATVSKTGEVKAVGKGKAVVTAKTANGKSATCQVVVNVGPAVIVDISQHNYTSKMDWGLIATNVDLLILRCGVTRTDTAPIGVGKDDKFAFYAKKCKEYDIPFGVYFYGKCSDEETAIKEAKKTWEVASPYNPLFYVYDCEEARLTKQLIETYMRTLKSLGAKKTGYYIGHHLYTTYKLDTSLVDFIWLPRYGKNTGEVDQSPLYPCDLHQYTSLGKIPGFRGPVDVNRLMGTKTLEWFISR